MDGAATGSGKPPHRGSTTKAATKTPSKTATKSPAKTPAKDAGKDAPKAATKDPAKPVSSKETATFNVTVRAPRTAIATVLLAEDDNSCRAALRRDLWRAGFEVIEAANGLEAYHLFNNRRLDAVATDIMMPAMDGFPLIDLVLKADPSMAVVAFTGSPSVDPAGSRLLFEKNVEMLHKPFPSDALVAALQRALANRKA